jgi:hypothetical protein
MYIEYVVPFIYIGSTASLKDKTLSIGWKMREGATGTPGTGEGTAIASGPIMTRITPVASGGAAPASGRGGGSNGRGGARASANLGTTEARENNFKETSVWTKHVLTF